MQDGSVHTVGNGTTGRRVVLADPPAPPMTAPVRNRYYYGKLLDVYHLELEQRYFLEQRRRLNRLTVGFGVVCGLDVTVAADGKAVIVSPGFAIDGLGREILVTEPICVADPSQLTDGCGKPAGTARQKEVTLCLAYHECESEPTPVLVSDCDVREGCAAGAIRERYALLVHDGMPASPPYGDIGSICHLLAERLTEIDGRQSSTSPTQATVPSKQRVVPYVYLAAAEPARPEPSLQMPVYHPAVPSIPGPPGCDPPAETCVVLATVTLPAGRASTAVDPFTYRRTVLSNDSLYEAVLCLASAVERCCQAATGKLALEVVSGNAQAGRIGAKLPKPVVVRVTEDGKPAKGIAVRFEVISKTGGGFAPVTRTTNARGLASSAWTLGATGPRQAGRASIRSGEHVAFTANAKEG